MALKQGMLSGRYKLITAKRDKNKEGFYLPLWMHLRDTAGIMGKLVRKWLPGSVRKSCKLDEDVFDKLAVFLAAVHDCGKATSYFQSIITINSEMFCRLNDSGLLVKRDYINRGRTPHSFAGQCILQSGMAGIRLGDSIAGVIGAHHGKPMDEPGIFDADLMEAYPANFYGKQGDKEQEKNWSGIWKEIADEALKISGLKSIDECPKININSQVLLSALLIAADWISSNTEYFPLISMEDDADESLYPLRVNEGWEKCSFPQMWMPETGIADGNLFSGRFGFGPNEVQSAVLQAVNNCIEPGIFILEAQMGCGKTEAALCAAEVLANKAGCSGLFFALPTQATSNGIYHRLYEWAAKVSEETKNAIRLAHSGAEYNEEYQQQLSKGSALVDDMDSQDKGLTVHPWFQGNKRALLADFVIGTVDQFLMGALKKKHFMLRHLGLAGKVVIIDECHAYDAYMNSYLDRMIEWMASYKIPVILLSATLPVKRRNELISIYTKPGGKEEWKGETGYPLLTWTDGGNVENKVILQDGSSKCIGVKNIDARKSLIRLLNEKLSDGGCACIIANTVKSAQHYYDLIESEMKEVNIILYHAQYLMADRTIKERELLEKMGKGSLDNDRRRLILIGTQVLEQSLDYDADIMFTELCPIDLMLQRMGRLHRHDRSCIEDGKSRPGKLSLPECYILMNENSEGDYEYDEGSKKIYGGYLLDRTKKIMPDILKVPEDIPKLVQAVYREDGSTGDESNPSCLEARNRYFTMIEKKKAKAGNYLLRRPKGKLMGMLSNDSKSSESGGEQQVRDSGTTIEVILMKEADNGTVCFIDKEKNTGEGILKSSVPDSETARKILRQRIRLPQIFSMDWTVRETINELEKRQEEIADWQKSPWLCGELIILLDKNNETNLNGYRIHYDFSKGLVCEKC